MKLPGARASLFLLAVGLAGLILVLEMFGASEKGNWRAEQAQRERTPHADLATAIFVIRFWWALGRTTPSLKSAAITICWQAADGQIR